MSNKEVYAKQAGTVSLGNVISVHRLGYGAMRLTGPGIWGPPKDRKAALAVLRRAVELGVNLIDTADSYGPNVSEELIAEALHPYPADLVIATKGGWERPGPNQWTHNATPDHLRKAIEGSLKRLRLERIDVYQLHAPDNVVSFDVSVETLAELKREGRIRMVALSNVTRSTSIGLVGSSRSSRSRTGTVSPTANGITSSTIARETGLCSSHGSHSVRDVSPVTFSTMSHRRTMPARHRLHLPGSCSGRQ
jgi:aryl-alcohol dehydrogenase-like predicted oxidoreductase